MEDIPRFIGSLVWNFWTVAIGIILAIEPVMRSLWSGYDAWASAHLTPYRQQLKIIAVAFAFTMANYLAYHDAKVETRSLQDRLANLGGSQLDLATWAPLTSEEAASLRDQISKLTPQQITVACESLKCKDLADGIANILKGASWEVTILHRGGIDITGFVGIRLSPQEDSTKALKRAIESATKLKVEMGDETRKDVGSAPALLVIANKPF
jgi:hypothetical protein